MQLEWFRGDYRAVAGGLDSLPGCKDFWRGYTYVSWAGGVLSSVGSLVTRVKCFPQELPIPVYRLIGKLKIHENPFLFYSAYLRNEICYYRRTASNPCPCGKESKTKGSPVLQIRECQEGSTSPPSSLRCKLWQCHHRDLEPGGRE